MSTAVMRERMAAVASRFNARIIGVVYLLYFLTAIFGAFFTRGLVVAGDAAATANNILAHEPSLRFGLAVGLIATMLYIAVTALFYNLFKPVNRSLSLFAAFVSLVGCAIQAVGNLFQLAPLVVLSGGDSLSAFTVEQSQALALMFLKMNAPVVDISLVFFGLYCLLLGYLIIRSTFLPRILGALMVLAGLGWLIFLYPPLANYLLSYIEGLGGLAEGLLMLWLLIMGVNDQRWKKQASAAGARA